MSVINKREIERYIDTLNSDRELSDVDINRLIRIFPIINDAMRYIGVYRLNTIPEEVFNPTSRVMLIINLDKHGEGTHWTAMIVDGVNIYYSDSYGMPMPDELINKFNHSGNNGRIYWSSIQRQPIDSNKCGWHCITWLSEMIQQGKNRSLIDTYNDLDRDWLHTGRSREAEVSAGLIENSMVNKVNIYLALIIDVFFS